MIQSCQSIFNVSILLLLAALQYVAAQEVKGDSALLIEIVSPTDSSVLRIDENGQNIQELYGNVVVKHDSVYFKCDTAFITQGVELVAWGSVILTKPDSIHAFGDSLKYDSREGIVNLKSDQVILQNGEFNMLAHEDLWLNVNNNVGYFYNGGFFQNDSIQIESRRAVYNLGAEKLYMFDSVELVSNEMTLLTDSILYNIDEQVTYFLAPTRIETNEQSVYCEDGYYRFTDEQALFSKNAQFQAQDRQGEADSIFYNGREKETILVGDAEVSDSTLTATGQRISYKEGSEEIHLEGKAVVVNEDGKIASDKMVYNVDTEQLVTENRTWIANEDFLLESNLFRADNVSGQSFADGEVIWTDLKQGHTLIAEHVVANQESGYLKAYGENGSQAVFTMYDDDTTHLRADTLFRLEQIDTITHDTINELYGYYNVSIIGTSFSGVGDSLYFDDTDSVFELLGEPIMWTDSAQVKGDTMFFFLNNGRADRAKAIQNCSILSYTRFDQFWNQVKGRELDIFIKNNRLDEVVVDGNAESLYFVEGEDNKFVGCNDVKCGRMKILFADQQIDRIKFLTKPDGEFNDIKPSSSGVDFRLDGIHDRFQLKPKM